MDHIKKISARESIQQAVTTGEFVFDQRKELKAAIKGMVKQSIKRS